MTESPQTVHGRMLEGAHLTGYSFGRAREHLFDLLKDDRWRDLGYKDGSQFVRSVRTAFAGLDIPAEERASLARTLAPIASQRAIADMVGVPEQRIARDLGKSRGAPNGADRAEEIEETRDAIKSVAPNGAPAQSGLDAATAARKEADKQQRKAEAEQRNEELKAAAPAPPLGQYGVIVIDPPWPMEKIERDVRPNQVAFDYPTMDEAELSAYPLPAAEDCHLFVWTTHRFLPVALRLLDAWEFRYVCTFVWHKSGGFQPIGLPQYNSEFAVYARKGAPKFVDTKAFPTCFEAPRREHSRKPDEFYATIARVTAGPRIDIFAREPRDGFDVSGNETKKFAEIG